MTSLEFFNQHPQNVQIPKNWGNGELRNVKIDATLDYSPNYIQKDQPEKQYYQITDLRLSNVRAHDQVEPKLFELDMNEYQISQPFPMKHPFASHIVEKVMFPSFTAPEDPQHGEDILRSTTKIITKETRAQPEEMRLEQKISGFPYRKEVLKLKLPTQKNGYWQVDKQLYQNLKPDREQTFYPIPSSILAPNPRKRTFTGSLDPQAWNILRNKERELMQTQNQIDFYKDGLGTRAPFNSDNYHEKQDRLEKTGKTDESMRPYFKRGAGLYRGSLDFTVKHKELDLIDKQPEIQIGPYTQIEKDEYRMEAGREYKSYPEIKFNQVNKEPSLKPKREKSASSRASLKKSAKSITEKAAREKYLHDKHQRIELLNRFKNLSFIKPENDIKVLRKKHDELEKGGKAALKQNVADHVKTFYNQESKYLSERTELYKTSYNPYELKQFIEMSKPNRDSLSIDGVSCRENVVIPGDSYEHRPKLFADRVFGEFDKKKRAPLEDKLVNPQTYTNDKIQEDGFIHKQSIYGDSYNTKKFLQENQLVSNRLTEPNYQQLDTTDLDYQDITLKSKVDKVALNDFKAGYTDNIDYHHAREIVELVDSQAKKRELETYPRLVGPIKKPYEEVYSSSKIVEHSDGASNRFYDRVYDSPFTEDKKAEYEPLESDLKILNEQEQKRLKQLQDDNKKLQEKLEETFKQASEDGYSIRNKMENIRAREIDGILAEQQRLSTYRQNYTFSGYAEKPNSEAKSFYDSIEYTELPFLFEQQHRSRLISLQDKWSKSDSQKRFLSAHPQPTVDLRDNYKVGKRPVFISPIQAAKEYTKSMSQLTIN